MPSKRRFSKRVIAAIAKDKILGVRAGSDDVAAPGNFARSRTCLKLNLGVEEGSRFSWIPPSRPLAPAAGASFP